MARTHSAILRRFGESAMQLRMSCFTRSDPSLHLLRFPLWVAVAFSSSDFLQESPRPTKFGPPFAVSFFRSTPKWSWLYGANVPCETPAELTTSEKEQFSVGEVLCAQRVWSRSCFQLCKLGYSILSKNKDSVSWPTHGFRQTEWHTFEHLNLGGKSVICTLTDALLCIFELDQIDLVLLFQSGKLSSQLGDPVLAQALEFYGRWFVVAHLLSKLQ